MPATQENAQIKKTNDYGLFKLQTENRLVNPSHVANLKQSMEDHGNLTRFIPVIVNDNMQVIDGQHRLEACIALELPVYYIIGGGMTIDDVRTINTTSTKWTIHDYIHSYAEQGDTNYTNFQNIRDEFNITNSSMVKALQGTGALSAKAPFKQIRNGTLKLNDEEIIIDVRDRLDLALRLLNSIGSKTGAVFFGALLDVLRKPAINKARLEKKFEQYGQGLYKRYLSYSDNLRLIEDIYNYNQAEETRIRL